MAGAVIVYDDDCGFCTWWADLFDDHTSLAVVGFSALDDGLRGRLPDDFERCSHVVTDDQVYSCGESIEEALLRTRPGALARPVLEFLRRFGVYRAVRERAYRLGADHRDLWGRVVSKPPPARAADE